VTGSKLLSSAVPKVTVPLTDSTVAAVRRVTPSQHPFASPQQNASKRVNAGKRINGLWYVCEVFVTFGDITMGLTNLQGSPETGKTFTI
jgi:hypothetical protein